MPENNDTALLQAKFIAAFMNAAVKTFEVQCSYVLKLLSPHRLEPNEPVPTDICSIIGLTSSAFSGAIYLCFSKPVFTTAMTNMLGEPVVDITDDVADGAGELLNVIFGTAKTTLNNEGLAVEKALPTVIRGQDLRLNLLTSGLGTIAIPFDSAQGKLLILVSLGAQTKS